MIRWRAMNADYVVRPMTVADTPAVERLSDAAFYDLDVRTHRTGWPEPEHRSPERAESWRSRIEHLVRHDPRGCWVAEDASGVIGATASMRRDTTWLLATYAVQPGLQGKGVGRQVLDAALSYGSGCLRGMLAASEDPAAVRRYRLAGFTLHPTMLLWGSVPRAALPVVERVRDGSFGDLDLLNSVDRQVRDSAHGVDHEILDQAAPAGRRRPVHRLRLRLRPAGRRRLPAGRDQPPHRDGPALGGPGRLLPRPAGRRRPHHGRERVGHRCRDGLQDGAVDPRLPRAARHEAAGALPAERPLPVRVAVKGCRCDNN